MTQSVQGGYDVIVKISITRAKKTLSNLIRAVESGERGIIVRRGKPVVELLPVTKPSQKRPRFGTPRGKVIIHRFQLVETDDR